MHTLLVLIAIAVAIWAFFKWQQTKQLGAATATTTRQVRAGRPVQNLAIGDVVSYLGQDFLVEGKLIYNQEGFEWQEFRLVDGEAAEWIPRFEGLAVAGSVVPDGAPLEDGLRGLHPELPAHARVELACDVFGTRGHQAPPFSMSWSSACFRSRWSSVVEYAFSAGSE